MKIKLSIITLVLMALIWSCTPEVEDDQLIIYSQNNSIFEHYYTTDTLTVLVKTRYWTNPVRNGISLGDTSYSENTIFIRTNTIDSVWLFLEELNSDSNLHAVAWNDITNELSVRFNDSLVYVRNISSNATGDTLTYDSVLYPVEPTVLSLSEADSIKVDVLNNDQWYKSYEKWKDEMINLYR